MPDRKKKRCEEAAVDAEVLEEMQRIAEKSSPYSPYLDNIHDYRELAEVEKVQDWAKETEKVGYSISCIRSNRDDPPDVLARVDGKLVGIEVTDLVEYPKKHAIRFATSDRRVTTLTWKKRQNGILDFRWHGAEFDSDEKAKWEQEVRVSPDRYKGRGIEWTLELFRTRLADSVRTKDEKAGAKKAKRMRKDGVNALDSRLQGSLLLIFTPELYLQDHLAEYLDETEVRAPENFDRVFLMGHYVPGERPRRHPVFEVRLTA